MEGYKMKILYILIIILIILFGAVAGLIYFKEDKLTACTEEAKICPDGSVVVRVAPDCEFEKCPDEQIVGGDTDEHGCIGSAGYTWNKTKQECVREWEEKLKDACVKLGCEKESLFAGSKNSDKYYNCDCGWAKTINPENLICFSSDDEALANNRTKSEC